LERAICSAEATEDLIEAMQQRMFHTTHYGCTSLYHSNKVINVNIPLDDRPMDVDMLQFAGVRVRLQVG
jgi:hypothetical protein